jgi:hypothetical protein
MNNMRALVIIILIILWLLGYIPISLIAIPNPTILVINNHPITSINILIFFAIGWAVGILPRPLQAIASVLLLLWTLSTLGILTIIAGLPGIIIIAIIIMLAISLFF